MTQVRTLVAGALLGWLACGAQTVDARKAVDLTYTFDKNTIYWPTSPGFHWEKQQWGKTPGGYWYASANYGANEHGGRTSTARSIFTKVGLRRIRFQWTG